MIKKTLILIIGVAVGLLVVFQWRSHENIQTLSRGSQSDIDHEIAILITTNQSLRDQLADLQTQKSELNTSYLSYQRIEENIHDAEMLAGEVAVVGEGININLNSTPTLAELTDLLNELSQLGVEAISINGTRLTNQTAGISSYNDTLVFNGNVLVIPLQIDALGNAFVLKAGMEDEKSTLQNFNQRTENKSQIITAEKVIIKALK